MKTLATILMLFALALPTLANDGDPAKWAQENMSSLLELYQSIHSNPELSYQEEETAARLAKEWADAGFDVTTGVGGHGVVAIMKNGPGKFLMLRTEMDALPLVEKTGLTYASKKMATDPAGNVVPVMHACGHDANMTCVTGAACFLAEHRDLWSGTLMVIGQPAEEVGGGSKPMLEAGLFEKFGGKPDYAIAQHVTPTELGTFGATPRFALANVDSVDITVRGRGGHGSAPHTTSDPIVQAAHLILALQTIVSREVEPIQPAVVTVGSIHGGLKHNIISDEVKLQLTVRSYAPHVREQLLAAIKQKAEATAELFHAPAPIVDYSEGTPSLYNDPELTDRAMRVFSDVFGEENVAVLEPVMGGEDFSRYGKAGVPILFYRVGSISKERLEEYEAGNGVPSLHSSLYYPDSEETFVNGVTAMSHLALELLKKE